MAMVLIDVSIGRALQFVLLLVTLRVATSILTPAEMGKVALVTASVAAFVMLFITPVGMLINRRLNDWCADGTAWARLKIYAAYIGLISCISAVVIAVCLEAEVFTFEMPALWVIVLVAGTLMFQTINQTFIPALNHLGHARLSMVLTCMSVGASLCVASALALNLEARAQYWVAGLTIGQAAVGILGAVCLLHRLRVVGATTAKPPKVQPRTFIKLGAYTCPIAVSAGLMWLQMQAYRFGLGAESGLSELGLFVAGYGVSAGLVAGLESIVTTVLQPRLYRDAVSDDVQALNDAWLRYVRLCIPSLLLGCGLVATLAPEIVLILLGHEFQGVERYVLWGVLAEAGRTVSGALMLLAHVRMRTLWTLLPSLAGAVLSLGACAVLIPKLGADGAGASLALAGLCSLAISHVYLARKAPVAVDIRRLACVASYVGLMAVSALIVRLIPWPSEKLAQTLACAVASAIFLFGQWRLLVRPLRNELSLRS